MTQHEIVALRCPSCGGGITQPSRELAFGAEFRCDRCSTTSVLIIDRALVPLSSLQKLGEKVCTTCGRVAQREARFCQEGHALVRKCVKCLAEFAVDHQRCDSCGWPQSMTLGTVEGEALAFDRAVSDLADPSSLVLLHAMEAIRAGRPSASSAAITAAAAAIRGLMLDPSFRQRSCITWEGNITEMDCWTTLGSLGPSGVTAIVSLMTTPPFVGDPKSEACCLGILRNLGPAAREAAPMLRKRIDERRDADLNWSRRGKSWSDPRPRYWDLLVCLGAVSHEDALPYWSLILEEAGKEGNVHAVQAAFELGTDAIPTLEKFCGLFSGPRGQWCKAAVWALRNGKTSIFNPVS